MEDAALAEMLSNEIFMEQLRADPEFAAYLNHEAAYFNGRHGDAGAGGVPADKKTVKERLSTMGTGMKRRFANLASKFRRGGSKGPGSRGIGGSASGAEGSGMYSALLGDDDGPEAMTTDIDLDVAGGDPAFALGGDSDDEDDGSLRRRSHAEPSVV